MMALMRRAALILFAAVLAGPLASQSYTFVPNLVYGTYVGGGGATQNLLLDLYLPLSGATPRPLIIWIHGGAWVGGSRYPAPSNVTAFCAQGYSVASIDYRLSGTAIWPAQIQDCRGAIRWLRANAALYQLDPDRFCAWGSSAGGHLAAFVGTSGGVSTVTIGSVTVDLEGTVGGNAGHSSRVQSVIDWFGPTDFLVMRDFPTFDHEVGGSPESSLLGAAIQTIPALVATANPITFLTPDDPPLLIMHGTIDQTVPFNQSELLHAAALRGAGVPSTFFPIQGDGHGGPGFTSPAAVALVTAHLDATLLNPPAAKVSVVASDASAAEAGPDPGAFTIARTGSTAAPLAVRLAFGGTAVPGIDYAAPAVLAVIPAGASSAVVTISPVDDNLVEGPETVTVTVGPGAGYRIDAAAQSASVTLADDETAAGLPIVSVATPDASAGEAPGDPASFLFTRSGSTAAPLTVAYQVSGTAKNGVDFAALSGVVTIQGGSPSATALVLPVNDPAIEPSETVIVTLKAGATYVRGPSMTAGVFIADNDKNPALPTVSVIVTDPAASEAGPDAGTFALTRTLGTGVALNVPISFSGSAASGGDVAGLAGTASFAPGSAWAAVTVTPLADAAVEGLENVVLTILPAPQYQIASAPKQELAVQDGDVPAAAPPALAFELTPLRIGTTGIASVAIGQPGQPFGVAAASGPGFLAVPGFGQVFIDVATAIVAGSGTLDASGVGSFSVPIPGDVQLIGARVWLQAYVIDPLTGGGALSPALSREFLR